MANVHPPKYIYRILTTLVSHGFPAYLVGGCVRDTLMGLRPHDWDICTAALPEQIMELFPGSLATGLKHGTVTVRLDSRSAEVTTFRAESRYSDHRHPDSVCFVGDLTTDLSRRDFTINAMALSPAGLLADPFGGREDIHSRLIRCVGRAEQRFEEDALRMLRALRFSARLGFDIEQGTLAAISEKAPLAAGLSPERFRDELEKMLMTRSPEYLHRLIELGLMDRYLLCRDADQALLKRLGLLHRKAAERWAGLCAILLGSGCISSPEAFLTELRLDGRTVRCASTAVRLLSAPLPSSEAQWKHCLRENGVDGSVCAAACADALYGAHELPRLKAVLKSGECFSLKHLAVTGDDLLSAGLEGRELGNMLDFLLDYVIEHPQNNRRDILLSIAGMTEE